MVQRVRSRLCIARIAFDRHIRAASTLCRRRSFCALDCARERNRARRSHQARAAAPVLSHRRSRTNRHAPPAYRARSRASSATPQRDARAAIIRDGARLVGPTGRAAWAKGPQLSYLARNESAERRHCVHPLVEFPTFWPRVRARGTDDCQGTSANIRPLDCGFPHIGSGQKCLSAWRPASSARPSSRPLWRAMGSWEWRKAAHGARFLTGSWER